MIRAYLIFLLLFYFSFSGTNSYCQWVNQSSNTVYHLQDIHFVDDSIGLVCGVYGTVLKTINAGNEWIDVSVGVGAGLFSVFAIDEDTIYAARSSLYKIVNGGATWVDVGGLGSNASSIFDLEFLSARTGVLTKSAKVYRSDDYGNSWSEVYDGSFIRELQFIDDSLGFAYGGFSLEQINRGRMLKTIDGGITWDSIYGSETLDFTACHFIDRDTGFLFTYPDGIYGTVNGGDEWTEVNSNLPLGQVMDCAFVTHQIGYALGYDGNIYKTIDGAINWSLDYGGSGDPLLSLFLTESSAYVTGRDGKILKNDGFITQIKNLETEEERINIYPNPASGKINISAEVNKTMNLQIHNISGQLLYTEQITGDLHEIDLSQHDNGVYFYTLTDKQSLIKRGKIIIVKSQE